MSPAILTARLALPGAEPEVGLSVSQLWLLAAVQLRLPPPLLVMLRDWFEGFAPPWVAVKVKAVGERKR